MARVDVLMPQMGESIAEGTLSKWLKKLGDEVKRDEPQVEISTIPGTGFAGRVTKQDILGVIERGAPAPTAPGSRLPAPGASGPVQHPTVEPWPGDRVEPFSKIRKITADHMIMSRRTSAHVTSFFEIDYSRVAELRRKHKAAYAE